MQVASRFPDLLGKQCKDKWAGDLADRVMTLLNHTRRLLDPIRWNQAIKDLTEHQIEILDKLKQSFDMVDPSLGSRSLRLQVSDCSVDSMGLPHMSFLNQELESVQGSAGGAVDHAPFDTDGLLKAALETPLLPCRKQDLQAVVKTIQLASGKGQGRQPKEQATPKGKATPKGQATPHGKARGAPEPPPLPIFKGCGSPRVLTRAMRRP